ncbi:RNA-guided endonuclease TnpB family protein [Streptomyces sp. NPDC092295]|uniref:RNA-guided endonuclease TnpB family protein n=1 Tax=Streptomyces sp. NPDC092295 TaxID=3366011 RepID=UPI003822FF8B
MPIERRVVQQAYKYALDPTPRQERAFLSHAGGARFAYNWGIARTADALDAYAAEKAAGVGEPATRIPGHFDLCKAWTVWKDTTEWTDRATGTTTVGVAWVADNYSGTYQAALRDAAEAWKRFFKARKSGARRVGRPRFKRKGRVRDSFQLHGGGLQIVDGKHIRLPRIGTVKTFESTRKIGRLLCKDEVPCPACDTMGRVPATAAGESDRCSACKATGAVPAARIVRGSVSRDSSGRWFVSLTVVRVREIRTAPSVRQRSGGPLGIDFGIRDIATLSTGTTIPNPRSLEAHLKRLKGAQQALARSRKGSARRDGITRRIGRLHARVRNLRADFIAKATTRLIHAHSVIAVEGWDVQQTAQHGSPQLPAKVRSTRNRALADTGVGAARWQLQCKAAWYGGTVVTTDRHAPTGRQCSACGTVKTTPLRPTQDEYRCAACGIRLDRRLNTARVLAAIAAQYATGAPSGGEPQNDRRGNVGPLTLRRGGRSPMKREARTQPPGRGQSGTPGT